MLFTSPSFLFLFLPAILAIYALIPQHYRRYAIVLFNIAFYIIACLSSPISILLALLSAAITYIAGFLIAVPHQRRTLIVAIAINVMAFLTYRISYAYSTNAETAYYPLGATFYLMASISYLIDIYRNDAPHAKNIADLLLYMFFFPTLIVGPVIKYKEFGPMIEKMSPSLAQFSEGVKCYLSGFFKRIAIAAVLSFMLARITAASNGEMNLGLGLLCLLLLGLQAWFSFSGYSDMAVGLMHMLGISYRSDFLSPFAAAVSVNFFRRAFISLNRWLEDYFIYPILRLNLSARLRRILSTCIRCIVPALWIKIDWYMLIPALPVLIWRIWRILRENKRSHAPYLPNWVRRGGKIVSALFFFSLYFAFAAMDGAGDILLYAGQVLEHWRTLMPYAMYAVFGYFRYLTVGALGLLFLLPLRTAAEPRLQRMPQALSVSIRAVSLAVVMICFSFSIQNFLPQFPQYATTAFDYIVL